MLERAYRTVEAVGVRLRLHRVSTSHADAIVMYHSVRDPERVRRGTSDLTVAQFRAQLSYLDARFELVDLGRLVDTAAPDRKRVALTFDDGYRDFHANVLPLLREYDAPATAFLVPGFLDGDVRRLQAANAGHVYRTLTHAQVCELIDEPLVTVGNHTRTHHDLSVHEERDVLREEIVGGRDALADRFGIEVDRFCYPFGRHNPTSRQQVRESHALAVRAESRRAIHPSDDRHLLPRIDGGLGRRAVAWRASDLNRRLVRAGEATLEGE